MIERASARPRSARSSCSAPALHGERTVPPDAQRRNGAGRLRRLDALPAAWRTSSFRWSRRFKILRRPCEARPAQLIASSFHPWASSQAVTASVPIISAPLGMDIPVGRGIDGETRTDSSASKLPLEEFCQLGETLNNSRCRSLAAIGITRCGLSQCKRMLIRGPRAVFFPERWTALTRYPEDGAASIDHHAVENQTHDPHAYLKEVPTRLPTQCAGGIDQLLPHQWVPTPLAQSELG